MGKSFEELFFATDSEIHEFTKIFVEGHEWKNEYLRWVFAKSLVRVGARYRKTKDNALALEAIYICLGYDFPIPCWASEAFSQAYLDVTFGLFRSWDDAFGKPHVKGTNIAAKYERITKSATVYREIESILESEPNTPIDGALFERVGRKLGIGGKTKTEEYYYDIKSPMNNLYKIINSK